MSYLLDVSLLKKNRDYRLLYLGQFVSFLGTMITGVALPYQIYHITGSTIMVGLVSLVQLLPLLITALIGGVFADRHNRRALLLISELLLAISCGLLAVNAYQATPNVSLIFIVAAVMSALNGLHRPALNSISGWTAQIKYDGRAIAIAAALWGAAIISFGLSQFLWLALLFLALSGAFDAISGIFRSTLWNSTIPTELRGRLAGIEMISYINGPKLGDTRAGFLAAIFGIPMALISGGVLCIVGVGLCCFALPKFWNYRSEH